MTVVTWNAFRDVSVAQGPGGTDLGAGTGDTIPIGLYSGYLYRGYWRFSYGFDSSWDVSDAKLYLRTSSQVKVAFGSDPDIMIQRVSADWPSVEGVEPVLSGSNATTWDNQPSRVSANEVVKDVSTAENTWVSATITGIIRDAIAAGQFHGIGIRANNEGSSTDVTEFWSREKGSSYDAYIVVTYTIPPTIPEFLVRRGAAWVQATDVAVRRGAAWDSIADEGYVRRGGVWVKA